MPSDIEEKETPAQEENEKHLSPGGVGYALQNHRVLVLAEDENRVSEGHGHQSYGQEGGEGEPEHLFKETVRSMFQRAQNGIQPQGGQESEGEIQEDDKPGWSAELLKAGN